MVTRVVVMFVGRTQGLDDGADAAHVPGGDRPLLPGQHHALLHQHDQVGASGGVMSGPLISAM